MSAHVGLPLVLSRAAEAVDAILMQSPQVEIARQVGVAHSTIPRRGSDLSQWPVRDLLVLAAHHQPLRQALASWTRPDLNGPSLLLEAHCREAVQAMGVQIGTIMARLDDGYLDTREAAATDDELARIQAKIAELRDELAQRIKAARP